MPEPIDYESRRSTDSIPARRKLGGTVLLILAGFAFTPVAAFLAIASGGAGQGDYLLARLLYPVPMLLTRLTGDTISYPSIWIALLQFPLYGVALGVAQSTGNKAFRISSLVIGSCHALAAIACFCGLLPNFS